MFSTHLRSSVFLIDFQSDSNSRPWLWTPDSDCYELNRVYRLSITHYMLGLTKLPHYRTVNSEVAVR